MSAPAAAAGDDKRLRTDAIDGGALVVGSSSGGTLATSGTPRTSDLLAPIMCLSGHTGPVLSCRFSPDGQHLVSGSHDKLILLWETFGECRNLMTFKGHSKAVLEVQWAGDGEYLFSARRTGRARCGTHGRARARASSRATPASSTPFAPRATQMSPPPPPTTAHAACGRAGARSTC